MVVKWNWMCFRIQMIGIQPEEPHSTSLLQMGILTSWRQVIGLATGGRGAGTGPPILAAISRRICSKPSRNCWEGQDNNKGSDILAPSALMCKELLIDRPSYLGDFYLGNVGPWCVCAPLLPTTIPKSWLRHWYGLSQCIEFHYCIFWFLFKLRA